METAIPDKLFYKIGEVAELTSLRPSVLRYWETEFNALKPNKSRSGQRLYSKKDLELILEIKRLLYSEKLTIEGARKSFAAKCRFKSTDLVKKDTNDKILLLLREVKTDLEKLRNSL